MCAMPKVVDITNRKAGNMFLQWAHYFKALPNKLLKKKINVKC